MITVDTWLLRQKMAEKKIGSIKELAELSDVNRDTIGNVLNVNHAPSMRVANALVDTLELNPQDAYAIFFAPNLRNTKVGGE